MDASTIMVYTPIWPAKCNFFMNLFNFPVMQPIINVVHLCHSFFFVMSDKLLFLANIRIIRILSLYKSKHWSIIYRAYTYKLTYRAYNYKFHQELNISYLNILTSRLLHFKVHSFTYAMILVTDSA